MNAGALVDSVLTRLDQPVNGSGFYSRAAAMSALNEAQRLFALLTLCLEATGTLTLSGSQYFYRLLTVTTLPRWLAPLRVRIQNGAKLQPCRLVDFDARNPDWQNQTGNPTRYACLGFDLFAIDRYAPVTLDVTYAQCPTPLANNSDIPDIPQEDHPALLDYAVPRLRAAEGGQAFLNAAPSFEQFFQAAARRAEKVRARNVAHGYDRQPFEIARLDRSAWVRAAIKESERKQTNAG